MNYETDFDALTNKYRSLTHSELLNIKPRWAFKDNIDKISNHNLDPYFNSYEIVSFKTKNIVTRVNFLELDPKVLFTRDDASDYRVAKILDDWQNMKFIDPPTLSISLEGQLTFSDGRHRTIVAYHLKELEMPIAFHKSLSSLIRARLI